jgi:hypothetical protein
MNPFYKSRDEAFMRDLHARIEGLSDSFDTALTSWTYFKKQVLLDDLHTYACSVLPFTPIYIPCSNVIPDVLFITRTEHEAELDLWDKVERSMQTVTKNIHRTSVSKTEWVGDANDLSTMLTILASEIQILQPKTTFLFHGAISHGLNELTKTPWLFAVDALSDTEHSKKEVNERLQQLVRLLTMKGWVK